MGEYTISLDPTHLDIALITRFFREESYWAPQRTRAQVRRSIVASALCFGVYYGDPARGSAPQVGFARVVSDLVTFAWLCDVFILEPHRGRGLAKWLTQTVMSHPQVRRVGSVLLATRDAHGLYQRYGGFQNLAHPERWMRRVAPRQ